MSLAGGLGGLQPIRNQGFQLTLFQPGGGRLFPPHACPPGFENLTTSLYLALHKCTKKYIKYTISENALNSASFQFKFHYSKQLDKNLTISRTLKIRSDSDKMDVGNRFSAYTSTHFSNEFETQWTQSLFKVASCNFVKAKFSG